MVETGSGDDDETLGAWALRYRGVATFGALAMLVGVGKFVGFHWHKLAFLRRAVVPPSVISGVLGCVVYRMFKGFMSPGVKSSLDQSLSEVRFGFRSARVVVCPPFFCLYPFFLVSTTPPPPLSTLLLCLQLPLLSFVQLPPSPPPVLFDEFILSQTFSLRLQIPPSLPSSLPPSFSLSHARFEFPRSPCRWWY